MASTAKAHQPHMRLALNGVQALVHPVQGLLLAQPAGARPQRRKGDGAVTARVDDLHGRMHAGLDGSLRRAPPHVDTGHMHDRLERQSACTSGYRATQRNGTQHTQLPEGPVARPLFDGTRNAPWQQKPPGNDVTVPGIDNHIHWLIQQVTVDDFYVFHSV